jgi:predicted NBD/HSP70 family sugar kinase
MKYVIGLDIGGTKISGIVYDGKKVVKELIAVTPGSLDGFKRTVLKMLDFLSAEYKITAVGVSIAGRIDKERGIVAVSPNLPYLRNFPLVDLIKHHGFKNIRIDNDAACFLLAETKIGQAKKYKNVFGIIIGTGIGGAILMDGKMTRGNRNMGGEIGRWMINGSELEKQYQACKRGRDFKKLQQVFGAALGNIINLLAPECVVVGGTYGQLYYQKFLTGALKDIQVLVQDRSLMPKLIISKLKNAGALGAALMASK